MKLEVVEAFPISLKIGESHLGGTFTYTHYQTVIVRVEVDGVEGWGEAMTTLTRTPPHSWCGILRRVCWVRSSRRSSSPGLGHGTGMNSVLSLVASIHPASVCSSVGVEYNPFPNPLQTDLGDGISSQSKGTIEVPKGPGLG